MARFCLTVGWPMYSARERGWRLVSTTASSAVSAPAATKRSASCIGGESSRFLRYSNVCSQQQRAPHGPSPQSARCVRKVLVDPDSAGPNDRVVLVNHDWSRSLDRRRLCRDREL